jgi:predicted TIM-barrel fold metal-dependent hydrolase
MAGYGGIRQVAGADNVFSCDRQDKGQFGAERMIIDFHVHTFPDKVAPKAVGKLAVISGIAPFTDGTVGDTLAKMDKNGIDLSVCLNIATRPGQERTINDTAAALYEASGGRLVGFGSVHPDSPDAVDELVRAKKLGLRGVKFHPDYQEFKVEEKRMWPLYEALQELDLFVTFHSGWDCYSPDHIHCFPEKAAEVAKAFPRLRMCFAHFGGLMLWEDVFRYLAGLENVYFDTAMAATMKLDPDLARRIIAKHPRDNIMLGSDCPWEDPSVSAGYVKDLGLSDAMTEAILGKNAERILGL